MNALPASVACLAPTAAGKGCGAYRLGLAACPSANIAPDILPHRPSWRATVSSRLSSITPTDLSVTSPSDLAVTFDYERALQSCAEGDRQALQSLYQHEGRHLLGVALRIVRQRQQAEDVLHDAFLNIWSKASSFDAELGSARGWIYSVTRNLAFNAVRNGAREVSVDEETAQALDARQSLETHAQMTDAFETSANLGRLQNCLSQLEPARRNCILYAYVDGCSHGEIAVRMQTPLGTVKAWIKRGMGTLRACMA